MEIALCHPAPESFRAAKELGCRRAYIDFSWALIQPRPGVFDFSYYDPLVSEAAALGLTLIATIASQRGIKYFPDGHWIWDNSRGMMPDPAAWGEFVALVAQRYKDTVRYWEVWSEPNCPACNPMSYYDPELYLDLLAQAAHIIRGVDSAAQIILGSMWPNTFKPEYLKALLAKGAAQFFDIFSWHFFLLPQNRESIPFDLWRDVLGRWAQYYRKQMPPHCPVWMTEFGLPTRTADSAYLHTHTSGPIVGLTEAEQADWFSQFAQAAEQEWGIEVLVWLMLQDSDDPKRYYTHNCGLLRSDGTPKPVRDRVYEFQLKNHAGTTAERIAQW